MSTVQRSMCATSALGAAALVIACAIGLVAATTVDAALVALGFMLMFLAVFMVSVHGYLEGGGRR